MNSSCITNEKAKEFEWNWLIAELTSYVTSFGMSEAVANGKNMDKGELFRFTKGGTLWVNEKSGVDIETMTKQFYRELAVIGVKQDESLIDDVLSTFAKLYKAGALSERDVGVDYVLDLTYGISKVKNMNAEQRFLSYLHYLSSEDYLSPKDDTIKSVIDKEVAVDFISMLLENEHARDRLFRVKKSAADKLINEIGMLKYGDGVYSCLKKRKDRSSIRELDRVVDHLASALRRLRYI